jgi:hypothetical protein
MSQPSFVPIAEADQVRPARRLQVPASWTATRPAELRTPYYPKGRHLGTPGPDQGFAIRLARRFEDRLHLAEGESAEDVILGGALLASRRAAVFGRAPSIHDVVAALNVFGYLRDVPDDLVAARSLLFNGVTHDYQAQRELIDAVPQTTLALAPQEVASRNESDWRSLFGPPDTASAA